MSKVVESDLAVSPLRRRRPPALRRDLAEIAQLWPQHAGLKPWWADVAKTTVEHFPTEALVAEREAIKTETPIYNVVHNVCPPVPAFPEVEAAARQEALIKGLTSEGVLLRPDSGFWKALGECAPELFEWDDVRSLLLDLTEKGALSVRRGDASVDPENRDWGNDADKWRGEELAG